MNRGRPPGARHSRGRTNATTADTDRRRRPPLARRAVGSTAAGNGTWPSPQALSGAVADPEGPDGDRPSGSTAAGTAPGRGVIRRITDSRAGAGVTPTPAPGVLW